MKKILFILIFLTALRTYSQTENLPQLKDYSVPVYFWSDKNLTDKKVSDQKAFWPNNKVKVEYEYLHDSTLLRKDYFESGTLKLTAEVYQVFRTDSMFYDSLGQTVLRVYKGYSDILHGKYSEYWDAIGVAAKTTGTFKNGQQCGQWTERQSDRTLVVATYNDNGQLDGPYYECYFNGANDRANIKWKGQYGVVTYSCTISYPLTEKVTITESVRIGDWIHYDLTGEILETVTYKWEKQ